MNYKKKIIFSVLLILFPIILVIFIEGLLSFIYSSNYFSYKNSHENIKKNQVSKLEKTSIDPYNNKIKSYQRRLANRYTNASNGRWAPNTLARKYDYYDYVTGKGEGLYTDNYGFIHNGDPDRKLFQDEYYNIIIIGGSTVEGANTTSSNEKTIAAVIEKKLRNNNKKINLINAGMSGYKSFDEFMMSYNLLGKFNFQEIIFMNGVNDFLSLVYSTDYKWNYYKEIINYNDQFKFNFNNPYKLKISYYANQIKSKFLKGSEQPRYNQKAPNFLLNKFQEEFDTYFAKDLNDNFAKIIKNYVYNIRLTKSFCLEFEIKCKFILQPHYGSKNIKHDYEKKYHSSVKFENFEEMLNIFFKAASKELEKINKDDEIFFYDLNYIFKDDKNLVYLDLAHYSDYGNQKIAQEIFKIIEKN